ncbi:hypothetical protein Drorol1_Dr00012490, partial [Drosera rotundifolia]
ELASSTAARVSRLNRIMFDRRFKRQDNPLFNKLKALHEERSRLVQSFEYNYGDFIPVLRPFLRGYLKICKEVKERRLQLFNDYFVGEHNFRTILFLGNIVHSLRLNSSFRD